jgi:type I restriction enzyme M protein
VDIGGYVDEAMEAIERQNVSLRGVLPTVYARQNLDRTSLSGLIDLIGTMTLGTEEAKSKDVLGNILGLALYDDLEEQAKGLAKQQEK